MSRHHASFMSSLFHSVHQLFQGVITPVGHVTGKKETKTSKAPSTYPPSLPHSFALKMSSQFSWEFPTAGTALPSHQSRDGEGIRRTLCKWQELPAQWVRLRLAPERCESGKTQSSSDNVLDHNHLAQVSTWSGRHRLAGERVRQTPHLAGCIFVEAPVTALPGPRTLLTLPDRNSRPQFTSSWSTFGHAGCTARASF